MKLKFVTTNGTRDYLSPLILSGKLIASGVEYEKSYKLAIDLVNLVPDRGMLKKDFSVEVIRSLPNKYRERYVTLEVVKNFLLCERAKSPLFIFLGGLAGKTLLGNYISQQLGLTQAIAIDNEKYRVVDPQSSQEHLWKATYESPEGYIKTADALIPWMIKMIERNLFDYSRYRKWCYLWEGIYLSPKAIKKIYNRYGQTGYFFSVFILPKFEDVKGRYLLRWQKELGIEGLQKRKNIIDSYLKNIKAIRGHIAENIDPVASFVIESVRLETRLEIFYILLHQALRDIANKEIPGWIEKILEDPKQINNYQNFINS